MSNLTNPAAVDTLLHDPQADLHAWLAAFPESPLRVCRALQVAVTENDHRQIHALLPRLTDHAPAPGLRLLALAQLEDWDAVLSVRPSPAGYGPLDLECMVHAFTAYGVANAERGDFTAAAGANQTAVAFASALGMHQRAQMLELELQRVLTLSGRPAPEMIERQLIESMPLMRRRWGQRNLAESYMALGSYGLALRSLGLPCDDDADHAALREHLLMCLTLPPARSSDDALLSVPQPYLLLAQAAGAVEGSRKVLDLEGVTNEPEATYARLMRATVLMMTPGMAQDAADLLATVHPVQPDHVFSRRLLLLASYLRGAAVERASDLPALIYEAIERLRPDADLIRIMYRLAPAAMLLLRWGPAPHPRMMQVDELGLPLLAGKLIHYQGEKTNTPAMTGVHEVLRALGQDVPKEGRVEAQRYRDVLATYHRPVVNLGTVTEGCLSMVRACRTDRQPSMAIAWREAARKALLRLTVEVQELLPTALQRIIRPPDELE